MGFFPFISAHLFDFCGLLNKTMIHEKIMVKFIRTYLERNCQQQFNLICILNVSKRPGDLLLKSEGLLRN